MKTNNVKYWREKNNLTQNELAEKSGVSLRTIQRIEKGSTLKGFTLTSIAKTLGTDLEDLLEKKIQNNERAKTINLSVLSGFFIPFGSVVIPLILTLKTNDPHNKQLGKKIVEVQILLLAILSVLLIALIFLQKEFVIRKPLFMYCLIFFLIIKLTIVIVNGVSLNKKNKLSISLKNKPL